MALNKEHPLSLHQTMIRGCYSFPCKSVQSYLSLKAVISAIQGCLTLTNERQRELIVVATYSITTEHTFISKIRAGLKRVAGF